ncbi:MAG: ABC transporter ATP-binding protein [Phycisphaerae bacterium]|nr:ABC transporter ATP-binding protein [Phycisphaerae bacterium]
MTDSPQDNQVVISVANIGKCYQIYDRPQDRLKQAFFRWRKQFYREFWALRNVSFEVRRGEAIGIVGRNGCGKSTLLQIIAGTLRPTEGDVMVRGRVSALLELGTGFNPEFTGRENVEVQAALLGLSGRELEQRYERIAAFADIGDFLNQPVKTYSSGMTVRLAFAVAAHVDADILIVDEALAVGDEGFQRKCYGWLERFQEGGGTLLFVTHGTQTVVNLCDRALLLDAGTVLAHGAAKPVTDVYQKMLYGSPKQQQALRAHLAKFHGLADPLFASEDEAKTRVSDEPEPEPVTHDPTAIVAYLDPELSHPPETTYGVGGAEITEIGTFDEAGKPANVLVSGKPCELRYAVRFDQPARGVRFGMMLKTVNGIDVVGVSSVHLGWRLEEAKAGSTANVVVKLVLNVPAGVYFLNTGVSAMSDAGEVYLHRRVDVAAVRVVACDERDITGLAFADPRMTCSLAGAGAKSGV